MGMSGESWREKRTQFWCGIGGTGVVWAVRRCSEAPSRLSRPKTFQNFSKLGRLRGPRFIAFVPTLNSTRRSTLRSTRFLPHI